jgi:hypothetical protein
VLSYLVLRGKLFQLQAPDQHPLPAVELATACFFVFAALHHVRPHGDRPESPGLPLPAC